MDAGSCHRPFWCNGGIVEKLALDGNTLAVADAFSAYIYVRTGQTWSQQAKLGTNANDDQIESIALQGDTVAVGQPFASNGQAPSVGRVRIYQRAGTNWSLQTTLNPSDVESYLRFGDAIAFSGNTIVVGAANSGAIERQVINGQTVFVTIKEAGIGSAYIFEKNGASWGQKIKLSGKQKRRSLW